MPESLAPKGERRRNERYVWTPQALRMGPARRPMRLETVGVEDIVDISAASARIISRPQLPQNAVLSFLKDGTNTTLSLALSPNRDAVFLAAPESRPRLGEVLEDLVTEGLLERSGRRSRVGLSIVEGDCFNSSRQCPTRPNVCLVCGHGFDDFTEPLCPACLKDLPYPNVMEACLPSRRQALRAKFDQNTSHLTSDQVSQAREVLLGSTAIHACGPQHLLAVLWDETTFKNYHELVASGRRPPDGRKWAYIRAVVAAAVWPGYEDQIRFAALSLDGRGVRRFGQCFVTLHETTLRQKASVFEDNSAVVVQRYKVGDLDEALKSMRAAWPHRDYLALAKLAPALTGDFTKTQIAPVLLSESESVFDERFVEVHVYGPIGRTSVAHVSVPQHEPLRDLIAKACADSNITFESRP